MKFQWNKYYVKPTNYSAELQGIAIGKDDFFLNADICLVYKIRSVDSTEPEYYWGAKLSGAKIATDGSFEYASSQIPELDFLGIGGDRFKAPNGYEYIGYETLEALCEDFNIDEYNEIDTDIQELIK